MTYEEGEAILSQFELTYLTAFAPGSAAHGIRVTPAAEQGAALTVLIAPDAPGGPYPWGDQFTYQFEGHGHTIPVGVARQERFQALARRPAEMPPLAAAAPPPVGLGDSVVGNMPRTLGTVGLNFYFNGALSFLTCWHVVCPWYTSPPNPLYISFPNWPNAAVLTDYRQVHFGMGNANIWDLAIGRYVDAATATSVITACNTPPPYPQKLAPSNAAGDILKVGVAYPRCRSTTYKGAMFRGWVDYDRDQAWFIGQLETPLTTTDGDSGALAIYRDGNTTILGLHFAVSRNATSLANPLYNIGWNYQGTRKNLPVYTG